MTTVFSADFYEHQAHRFDGKRGIINPDSLLESTLKSLTRELFTEDDWKCVEETCAKRIAEKLTEELIKGKEVYLVARYHPSHLGYTTKRQEVEVAARIVENWEYNCFKLSRFKSKYNLNK